MSVQTPKYRLHKPTGQAAVTLNGRHIYLGKHGSTASRVEYDRLVAEWLANGRRLPTAEDNGADLTVVELIASYCRFAEGYYRKNGEPTSEVGAIKLSMRPLRRLYELTPARDFSPLKLKAVRKAMIDSGLCRGEVNKRTGRVVRMFKWGVENELVPPSLHHGLKAVRGIRGGRSEVREAVPVKPVPEAHVDALRDRVARQVWAMIELQRVTGMRPGEVCSMRTADVDVSGRVWVYTPESHKTQHHGRERTIYLGPRAEEILKPWLRSGPAEYLFSPREAAAEKSASQRQARKTRVQPSQRARKKKPAPKRAPKERYEVRSYSNHIRRACKASGTPHWHPHQLRHNAATWLRKEFGLDVARVVLGHASPAVTETYAEVDREKARKIMEQVG